MVKIPGDMKISGVTSDDSDARITLDALMLAVMTERAELLEGQVRRQVNYVRSKNDRLKTTNQMMATARQAKHKKVSISKPKGEPWVTNMRGLRTFLNENNIKWRGCNWDTIIENMRGFCDSLTSTSQLDMAQLQSTMGKYNQTFEQLSNFISKYAQSIRSIVGNIR